MATSPDPKPHLAEGGKQRIEALEALRATVADITAELELNKLLGAILERAHGLLGAAGGELGLFDEKTESILIVASNYLGTDYTGRRLALGEGVLGTVAQTRQPMIIEDYFSWEGHSPLYVGIPMQSVIGVPMQTGGRLVGVLTVADPDPNKTFDQDDVSLLNLFAQQAAIAVENAHLYANAKRRAQEAETLRQAAAVVAASLQQDDAIVRILEQLGRVVPYDSASVQLLRDGYLEIVGGRGWPNPEEILGHRFPIPGDNPNTHVVQNREPLILPNFDAYTETPPVNIKSWLGVPLIVRERVIGMLTVDSTETSHFTQDHARLLTTFADQVAIALENTRLFEGERRRADELVALSAIASASAEAVDENEIIEKATEIIGETLYPDVFGVMLIDEENQVLRTHPSYRLPPMADINLTIPLGKGVTGRVAQDGVPQRIADVREEPSYIERVKSTRSELCVPLKLGGQIVGVVNAESIRTNAFSETDENMLITLADQLATSIERNRLYQAALKAAERRAVLYRASQEISASLHTDQIYRSIHEAAKLLMPTEIFVIALLDKAKGEIDLPYLFEGGLRYPHRRIPQNQGLSGHILNSGEPVRSGDFEATHGHIVDPHMFGIVEHRNLSILAVPIRIGEEVVGMLSAQSFKRDAFSVEDQDSLELLAIQAAIALNNAQLFEGTRRQLDELVVLHAVSAAGAEATSVDSLIEQATRLVGTNFYPDNFGILLLDEQGENLGIQPSYRGLRTEHLGDATALKIPIGEGICGAVAERGEPWRVPDVTREPAYVVLDPSMRSELCVPIKVGTRVIGVVNAESAKLNAFTEADERLLVTFASQLATAIEKVRLFEEVQHLAIIDALTDLYNRRHFFVLAEREFQRAKRYNRPLAAIMFDIDRFKRVNDTYGHAAGDQVLSAVARRCRQELREIDILGRYGGEEFVAMLPESTLSNAELVAKRLRKVIAETSFDADGNPVTVTISLGAAAVADDCANLDTLLRHADQALYKAKESGRNRVRLWNAG